MAGRSQAGSRRAIIVGGSMGGLLTALLLHRAGWRVDVYERIGSELSGRGAGIVTHQAAVRRSRARRGQRGRRIARCPGAGPARVRPRWRGRWRVSAAAGPDELGQTLCPVAGGAAR